MNSNDGASACRCNASGRNDSTDSCSGRKSGNLVKVLAMRSTTAKYLCKMYELF